MKSQQEYMKNVLPGNEITKVRNTKHYDKIYRKTNSYNPKQRASV